MPKERYICPEERQKINNEILKYNKFIRQYFKTSMVRSSLCGYSDAYILVSGTITTNGGQVYVIIVMHIYF